MLIASSFSNQAKFDGSLALFLQAYSSSPSSFFGCKSRIFLQSLISFKFVISFLFFLFLLKSEFFKKRHLTTQFQILHVTHEMKQSQSIHHNCRLIHQLLFHLFSFSYQRSFFFPVMYNIAFLIVQGILLSLYPLIFRALENPSFAIANSWLLAIIGLGKILEIAIGHHYNYVIIQTWIWITHFLLFYKFSRCL